MEITPKNLQSLSANEKALERLISYTKDKLQKTNDSYTESYRSSKWYEPPTLEDAFGEHIAADIKMFQKALESNDNISSFVSIFEDKAKEYGRSWFDEDLNCMRSGYEEESKIYVFLRNIAAEACEKQTIALNAFYEGCL